MQKDLIEITEKEYRAIMEQAEPMDATSPEYGAMMANANKVLENMRLLEENKNKSNKKAFLGIEPETWIKWALQGTFLMVALKVEATGHILPTRPLQFFKSLKDIG